MIAIFKAGDLPRAQQCQEGSLMAPHHTVTSHQSCTQKKPQSSLEINFPKFMQTSESKNCPHGRFLMEINYCNLIEIKTRLKAKKKSQTNLG